MKSTAFLCLVAVTVALCFLNESAEAQDSCFQGAEPGICRASIPRFYFDSRSGKCDRFTYGGCGGNNNNFRSYNECQSFRSYCLRRRGF
ncbi:Kunitz-type serine protease inhibitor 1 [Orchesella cincta]|uniref:Kunitz-type serine protease inhibitor 1 n=1 Tax=Orchesella cincta TaxID=48709 RepID=A0A1D2N8H6_ORCCI|nr:Kunitz-type serine protease inhibitor 1 [Orchesella cincta]